MGVVTYDVEIYFSTSPDRLFKGFVLDGDNIIRNIEPNTIKRVKVLEGDGHSVGTVRVIQFAEGSPIKSMKQRFDVIDKENRIFQYTVLEGEDFGGLVDSIKKVVKVEAGPDGGSIYKFSNVYNTKADEHNTAVQERIKEISEKSNEFFKAIDAYLQAHLDEYN